MQEFITKYLLQLLLIVIALAVESTMKILNSFNTRFRFSGVIGRSGEIPHIEIRDKEPLPPLSRASDIEAWILDRDKLQESTLRIVWRVGENEAYLVRHSKLSDSLLKEEYHKSPQIADQIIDLLQNLLRVSKSTPMREMMRSMKSLSPNVSLTPDEVPDLFQQYVRLVQGWRKFVKKHKTALSSSVSPSVTSEEYYVAPISKGSLSMGYQPEEDDYSDRSMFFDFDPKTQSPVVVGNAVYWEIPENQVLVVLPHELSDERTALYYGYIESFKTFQQSEAQKQKRFNEVYEANQREDETKLEQNVQALRSQLLS